MGGAVRDWLSVFLELPRVFNSNHAAGWYRGNCLRTTQLQLEKDCQELYSRTALIRCCKVGLLTLG